MMVEGPDSEIFDSELHQLTSLERYLAYQRSSVFSGDQSIVTSPMASLRPRVLHINALRIHTHYKWHVYSLFSYFYRKCCPPKTSSPILAATKSLQVSAVDKRKSDLLTA